MNGAVTAGELRAVLLSVPELATWPEAATLIPEEDRATRLDWQLPVRAYRAVGDSGGAILPVVAALACVKSSCILVDDILDEDPVGLHHTMGPGRAANLALALLAAGSRLLEQSGLSPERLALAQRSLSQMALTGAEGQEIDARFKGGEEAYWEVVRKKGWPFYGGALALGAITGGADPQTVDALYTLGARIGEFVQIYDDLDDAFEVPAAPDWRIGRPNLVILFGSIADHPQRDRLKALLPRIESTDVLVEAQRILLQSGAVSYAVFQLVNRYRSAHEILDGLTLADAGPLRELLSLIVAPLDRWLAKRGLHLPDVVRTPEA